ncbi:BMP family ABC transporter substrate-binding protein [Clostridium sp. DJ247]|uniref:BMP family ABC transporter substrate-binding protein n=1 Tax=Clostridium sp. DJ247 TaxID=2726188 RepID=UPI00162A828F|nr:BMP family ABC transporter substrate-binding protein [Clostridium sp. DJ247]MBC2582504.1 BMP family ABC transporter substrate-binding protein [Clostridium sp. DJ247]
MKKLLSTMLVMVTILVTLLTGCGSSDKNNKGTAENSSKDNKIKVGFLYVGPIGDGGYTYAHDQGRKYLEKETGVETVYKESVKEDTAEVQRVVEDMVNQGVNVVIGTSYGFMDGIEAEAKKHPNIKFFHCSGYKQAENMTNYFGRIQDMEYLAGIVAGMKTKTNKIGMVAAFPIPEVIRNINGFTLGVRSVKPDAVVKVTWTNTWYDPAKEKEAAKALIAKGVDVIAQDQDTAGPQQAAEEAGIYSIGYNTDMSKTAPKANMTSAIWNWGPYYVKQIKAIQNNTWKSESYWGGVNDGIVDLAPLTANAPEGAKEAVEKVKADIASGKKKVFAGPIKDQTGAVKVPEGTVMTDKELLSFDWFVQGVEGTIPKK